MTLLEQIKLNQGGGYDVVDNTLDAIFVALETETSKDACGEASLEFSYWLADNLEVVDIVDATAVCKVYELIEAHYYTFAQFCKRNNNSYYQMDRSDRDDNIEVAMQTLNSMIPGHYSNAQYLDFLKLISYEYTTEYCPYCESESVIYSNRATICPNCGKPLKPCSTCEDCIDESCPYGSSESGSGDISTISEKEIDWYNEQMLKPKTEQEAKEIIESLKPLQEAGEHFPCPRCGHDRMNEKAVRNALSRHADVYVCNVCGQDEALQDMCHIPDPLNKWGMVM